MSSLKWKYRVSRLYVRIKRNPGRYIGLLFILFSGIILTISACFFIGRERGWFWNGYTINNELWGNLGDFVGGMFGPLLTTVTIFFMWWTITDQQTATRKNNNLQRHLTQKSEALQQKLASDSKNLQLDIQTRQEQMAEMQRFNDLFFSLLNLYHEQVKTFVAEIPEFSVNVTDTILLVGANGLPVRRYEGKEFFTGLMDKLIHDFPVKEDYIKAKRTATNKFGTLYGEYSVQLSVYFRTVYRIFDLIHTSEIPEKEKMRYSKIMRAQLTRGEVFFLHYNACTQVGRASQKYIQMYRLTKHFHVLDHMEFQWLVSSFRHNVFEKKEGLNIALYHLTEELIDILREEKGLDERYSYTIDLSTRYQLTVIFPVSSSMTVVLTDYKDRHNMMRELKGFVDFKEKEFHWLLRNFMRLLFRDMNFGEYNKTLRVSRPLSVKSLKAMNPNTKHIVTVWNTDGSPLRLTHPMWD